MGFGTALAENTVSINPRSGSGSCKCGATAQRDAICTNTDVGTFSTVCGTNEVCQTGNCVCPVEFIMCGETCVDPLTDGANQVTKIVYQRES